MNDTQTAAARPNDTKPAPKMERGGPKLLRVRSVVGPMRHMLTNVEVTEREVKMEVDAFAQAQINAGKWEIVND